MNVHSTVTAARAAFAALVLMVATPAMAMQGDVQDMLASAGDYGVTNKTADGGDYVVTNKLAESGDYNVTNKFAESGDYSLTNQKG